MDSKKLLRDSNSSDVDDNLVILLLTYLAINYAILHMELKTIQKIKLLLIN